MLNHLRIPKPAYLLTHLIPRGKPDATLYRVLEQLAEMYQLGEIRACYRTPRSTSMNFFVTTPHGKFVFRRQHLLEDDLTYEYQILDYLQQRNFPAPYMLLDQTGQAWVTIDDEFYSVYEFMSGYCTTDFLWLPAAKREIITRCGRVLGKYHQAVADWVPSAYKWNGYRSTEHKRWREGDWFLQTLKDIRPLVQKSANPLDNFVQFHLKKLERLLKLEPIVEGRSDLSKVVIHGDYAPWNVFFRWNQSPFVLDFNESRLELKIYDIALATFWFARRNGGLDQDRVLAFQTGYSQTGQLNEIDINLAGPVFRWIMARSLIERLHKHYLLGQHSLTKAVAGLERQYQMCLLAEHQPEQLVAGLKRI